MGEGGGEADGEDSESPCDGRDRGGAEGKEGKERGEGWGREVGLLVEKLRLSQQMVSELEAANSELDRALHVALAVHQEEAHGRTKLQELLEQREREHAQRQQERERERHERDRERTARDELEAALKAEKERTAAEQLRAQTLQAQIEQEQVRHREEVSQCNGAVPNIYMYIHVCVCVCACVRACVCVCVCVYMCVCIYRYRNATAPRLPSGLPWRRGRRVRKKSDASQARHNQTVNDDETLCMTSMMM